ncbi:MAG: Holliday junction branch migration protein RuvA [Candidatus Nanopelagicales bacterium]|nr:Holliday junction branch migration protein RuvA [Candidatus Nanopelagicales bacterium]NKB91207.1 Holliday junction branch migration protein RuvA [Candidatus Nanopelagicales bacterium]
MIDRVRGAVVARGADYLSVDLGPVAVRVTTPPLVAAEAIVGREVDLHTALVVREDSWTLFGFADAEQCRMFEQVQTVSGIGPRIALGLVSVLGADDLRRAIDAEDLAALTQVPGIGKKGAQRIVLELKDKIDPPSIGRPAVPSDEGWRTAVAAGLTSLGWSAKEAGVAVDGLAGRLDEVTDAQSPDIGVLLKEALRSLDRS